MLTYKSPLENWPDPPYRYCFYTKVLSRCRDKCRLYIHRSDGNVSRKSGIISGIFIGTIYIQKLQVDVDTHDDCIFIVQTLELCI